MSSSSSALHAEHAPGSAPAFAVVSHKPGIAPSLTPFWRRLLWSSGVLFTLNEAVSGQEPRPMVVEDLFALEQLGTVAASPDGRWLAVVIGRPRTRAETYRVQLNLGDVAHADVWLVPRSGGKARNLTHGLAEKSGYWNPVWSPDSRHLAMLVTRGGERAQPVVWSMATDTIRTLTGRNADLGAYGDMSVVTYGMLWSDSTTLLCPISSDRASPQSVVIMTPQPYAAMVRSWAMTEHGLDRSVSVLESGRELLEAERPTGDLLAIDIRSGAGRLVARGNFRQLVVSPDRRHAAFIAATGRVLPQPSRRIPWGIWYREQWRTRLLLVSLGKNIVARWIDSIIDPKLVADQVPYSWSPDGLSLAIVGKAQRDDEVAAALWTVSVMNGVARQVTGSSLAVSASAWSLGGDLLALARRSAPSGSNTDTTRLDWWRISADTTIASTKLTSQLKVVPEILVATADRRIVIGLAGGNLWSIDARSGMTRTATDSLKSEIQSDIWPTDFQVSGQYETQRVFQTVRGELYRYDLIGASPKIIPLARPAAGASLAVFRPDLNLVAFIGTRPNGAFLWTGDGHSGRFEERIALNQHVREIADVKRMLISYRSIDGSALKALMVLPADYQKEKQYPLVTVLYPGAMVIDTMYMSTWFDKQSVFSLNLAPLVARGFVVLIPSIPLSSHGEFGGPYIELAKGVMPAVEKAIDLGIAGPQQLAVMGHSFGGYATYGLLTYTHRFKVGVSLAGFANLISHYGQFMPFQRYGDFPHEAMIQPALAESGQVRMGTGPWSDLWRYIRNSPISFVDRVQTPLMIIHGDMDYVSLQQGEEFFTALYRLGKKAKFVRYWGEGHVISSPANIRDMWQRIFAWFDEHLRIENTKVTGKASGN